MKESFALGLPASCHEEGTKTSNPSLALVKQVHNAQPGTQQAGEAVLSQTHSEDTELLWTGLLDHPPSKAPTQQGVT